MAQAWRNLFLPLHRLAHWPDREDYLHAQRQRGLDTLFAALDLASVHTAVELGAGDGYVSRQLADRFTRVIGFDLNPHRIAERTRGNLLLVAGDAERPPLPPGCADLVFSHSVMEHVPDRIRVTRVLRSLLKPGGRMIHVVPTALWKGFQWVGFLPHRVRKEVRGVTRSLAGQREAKPQKFHPGMQTNNPRRATRASWQRHLWPRVHGEYASNLDETIKWRLSHWQREFEAAGMRTVSRIPLEMTSPYAFGLSQWVGKRPALPRATLVAFVLEPSPSC
ncbi:MAG: class I SAM-dependent methyltransferase [Planctomycetota bacterium]